MERLGRKLVLGGILAFVAVWLWGSLVAGRGGGNYLASPWAMLDAIGDTWWLVVSGIGLIFACTIVGLLNAMSAQVDRR